MQRLGTSTVVNLDLPVSIAPRVLNALKADARTVDLRALAAHFYGLAARVLDLFEEEEVVDVLSEVRGLSIITPKEFGGERDWERGKAIAGYYGIVC